MSLLVVHAEPSAQQGSPALTERVDVCKVKRSVVDCVLILASISITVANAVIAVQERNSVSMVAVGAPQVISSVTEHALTRTSMTITVVNVEMPVLQTQVVAQDLAFLTLRLITNSGYA
jgi:hypothetical protein